jgi:hypothetical protein
MSASARTPWVRVNVGCVRADASVLFPDNFITDPTVRPSLGRLSGHRPTVRSSVIVRVTTLLQTMAAQHTQRNAVLILNHKMCVGIQLRQKIVVLPLELPDCQKTILQLLKVDISCKKENQIKQCVSRLQCMPRDKLNGKFASSNPKMAYHFFFNNQAKLVAKG